MTGIRRTIWFAVLAVALFAIAACGSQGQPPALGQPASATLAPPSSTQAVGVAHLTPVYGSHIAPNFQGQAIPYANAPNPVQLRKGACNGEVLAALTEGAPGPLNGASPPEVKPNPVGGMTGALAPSADLWVSVLDHTGDDAHILACGHPLSDRRQYFDLYDARKGVNGIALGSALIEAVPLTRFELDMTPQASGPVAWTVRSGSCNGNEIASGSLANGAKSDTIFATLNTSSWWVTINANGATACGKVK
jgi:predicted small lipoprotein YifL